MEKQIVDLRVPLRLSVQAIRPRRITQDLATPERTITALTRDITCLLREHASQSELVEKVQQLHAICDMLHIDLHTIGNRRTLDCAQANPMGILHLPQDDIK